MKKFILPVIVFLFLAFTALAQEKYTLKYLIPEGKYEMKMETGLDSITKVGDQTIPTQQAQTQYLELVAGPIAEDGLQTVNMETKRFVMKQTINGKEMEFDSADEKAKFSPFKILGAMVGLKITMTLDNKEEKTVKAEGIEEFMEKISKTFPKMVVEMLKKELTNESLTKNFDASWEAMPKTPVAVGDSWQSESSSVIPVLGKVKTKMDNTLKSVKTAEGVETAEIESKSHIQSGEAKEMEMGPIKMTYKKTDIESENTILLELKTGLVISCVAQIKMKMEAELNAGGHVIQQTTSGEGKTTITMKRID